MRSVRLRITGRVQGVGYRAWMMRRASGFGLRGWVRNRADGSVEAVLQGSPEAVEKIIVWARHGPPAALVAAVRTGPPATQFDRSYPSFEFWPTT